MNITFCCPSELFSVGMALSEREFSFIWIYQKEVRVIDVASTRPQ
jgi:hypothetical protein